MKEKKSILGYVGNVLGAVAFLLAVVHFWAGPFSNEMSLEQSLQSKVKSIKEAALDIISGKDIEVAPVDSPMDVDRIIHLLTAVLGCLAIIFGVFSFVNKEPMRVSGGAVALGSAALAFQFLVIALGILLLMVVITSVLN